MKSCPSCGALVPEAAVRCKECFADLTAKRSSNTGTMVAMLGMFALMAIIGAGVLWYGASLPLEEKVLVDEDTRSVIWTTKYRSGIQTKRLSWDQIKQIESVTTMSGSFEVVAVDLSDNRHVVMASESPLEGEAAAYGSLMEKPVLDVDKTGASRLVPGATPAPAPPAQPH